MTTENGIWFVRRSHLPGSPSKIVRWLEAPSILSWFQMRIDEARIADRPSCTAHTELNCEVEELSRFFQAVQDEVLRTPKSMTALRKVLREQLWKEADAEATKKSVLADNQTLRIIPPGSSTALLFLEGQVTVEQPERFSFLLRQSDELPGDVSHDPFPLPFDVPTCNVGDASGSTCVCMLGGEGHAPGEVMRLVGVELPGLVPLLRDCDESCKEWPETLRKLRDGVRDEDASLGPVLRRLSGEDRELTILEGEHVIEVRVGAWDADGVCSWIVFDERWAAANEALATSILRNTLSWDPCARIAPPARPRAAKSVRTRAATDKKSKTPRKPRPSKAAVQAEAEQRANWAVGVAGRTQDDAQLYNPRTFFNEGALIHHAKFGLGFVSRVEATKCEVVFEHDVRLLVHGVGGQPSKDPICL